MYVNVPSEKFSTQRVNVWVRYVTHTLTDCISDTGETWAFLTHLPLQPHIDGLVQDWSIFIANTLKMLQSCPKQSINALLSTKPLSKPMMTSHQLDPNNRLQWENPWNRAVFIVENVLKITICNFGSIMSRMRWVKGSPGLHMLT